ncbi:Isochorismatase hydrolase [Mytilinidion resinicola]|uniref:Isochorismatase hydrolase n=1 Tax=Mytilinidion resinicola TaxID=574789 RepID=A0A6A6YJ93_9PEZI|nr:Isochorismatase hydrolase [Mytilinidion resinicola]KAF2808922.1 Isochorismatase hydrolase [Mytilinidion resinicola]
MTSQPPSEHRTAVIGNASNFWLHSTRTGFDLTHPQTPTETAPGPRLKLRTSTSPITLSPASSALVIIDMQNFFLSPSFGRTKGPGHKAADNLLNHAIPAARKAGIQIIWLNWGLSDEDLNKMPPGVMRAFGFQAIVENIEETAKGRPHVDPFRERPDGIGVDRHGDVKFRGGHALLENGKGGRIYKGLGSSCGIVSLANGETVDAGRLLVRGEWNAALYPPLDVAFKEGEKLSEVPDVWIHKNRMSGMWGASTPCEEFLEAHGIKSLLFAGVNTDQCVSGTFTDAFSKGYDCILLNDCCGTTSPAYAQQCIEFNAAKTWGFAMNSEDFAKGVEEMEK